MAAPEERMGTIPEKRFQPDSWHHGEQGVASINGAFRPGSDFLLCHVTAGG